MKSGCIKCMCLLSSRLSYKVALEAMLTGEKPHRQKPLYINQRMIKATRKKKTTRKNPSMVKKVTKKKAN